MRYGNGGLGLGILLQVVQDQRTRELGERLGKLSEELAKLSKLANDDVLLSSKEVAPLVGVTHHKTVEKWVRERGLPCRKLGRNLRFLRGDVLAWRAQQES